jgi:hypothetical protein
MNAGFIPELDNDAFNEVEEGKKGNNNIHIFIQPEQSVDDVNTNSYGNGNVEKAVGEKSKIKYSQQLVHHHAGGTQGKQRFHTYQTPNFPLFHHLNAHHLFFINSGAAKIVYFRKIMAHHLLFGMFNGRMLRRSDAIAPEAAAPR